MPSCVFKPNETVLTYLYSDVNGNTSNNVKCPDLRTDGDKAIAATSFATFFLNVIVAVVLGYMLKQKMTTAKVHLFALAISDLSLGAVMILGAFLDWFYDDCNCQASFKSLIDPTCQTFQDWFLFSNRGITIYITFMRARAISANLHLLKKSLRATILELVVFGAIGGLIPIIVVMSVYQVKRSNCIWLAFGLGYFITICTIMTVLTVYILARSQAHGRTLSTVALTVRSEVKDEFETMVTVVAVVFCLCHSLGLTYFAIAQYNLVHFQTDPRISHFMFNLAKCFNVALYLNSAVNLFIYVTVSSSFRIAFVQICKKVVCTAE